MKRIKYLVNVSKPPVLAGEKGQVKEIPEQFAKQLVREKRAEYVDAPTPQPTRLKNDKDNNADGTTHP